MPAERPSAGEGLRVIVCGGRNWRDRLSVHAALEKLNASRGIAAVIQGGAAGVDTFAAEWGFDRGVPVGTYNADWRAHGKGAGPIRNQRMLDEAAPDGVVAFPGGRGTADMVRRADAAGIKVWFPCGRPT